MVSPLTWLVIAAFFGLLTWYLGKKSTSCGVMFGVAAVIALIALFLLSATFTIGGDITIK